jgi:hypothetical protein
MKPFDLQKALAGDPVITRDGKPVTEIHHFKTWKDEFRVFGEIRGILRKFKEDGRFVLNSDSDMDLFMAETSETGFWINVFYDKDRNMPWLGVNRYQTKEEAEEHLTDHKWYQTSIKLKL